MQKQSPSIFNDVLGPVMRGHSSSHTAASVRIGRVIRQFFAGGCKSCRVDFSPRGSLAYTFRDQGTDFGLAGGLLGMDPADPRLTNALEIAAEQGLKVEFNVRSFKAKHPNTYRITAAGNKGEEKQFIFLSTGGGMFKLKKVDCFRLSIGGDFYETLFFFDNVSAEDIKQYRGKLKQLIPDWEYCTYTGVDNQGLINVKTVKEIPARILSAALKLKHLTTVTELEPVLPILSRKRYKLPFTGPADLLQVVETDQSELWELAVRYESDRGYIPSDQVIAMAEDVLQIMNSAIREGLAGSSYADRILGPQAAKMLAFQNRLIGGRVLRKIIANISAVMEAKSAMNAIVAAPTAGACGVLPGTLFAAAEDLDLDEEDIIKGLLAAGLVGLLIAGKSTFAAEECGCQAECGSASGMAAAGLVQMLGGTAGQCLDAAAMALQNVMGMICDPVAERVEVPCLGKNILAGLNAIGCANMALAGFNKVIPLDETIDAFDRAGRMLPAELRCTGQGGLSMTKTAREIHNRLQDHKKTLQN